jgi:hypothetical protein
VTDELRKQIAEAAGAAVAQAIGPAVQAAVQAAVAPIVEFQREFKRDWQIQDQRATDSRGKSWERLGAVEQQMAGVSVHVQTTARDVAEIKGALPGYDARLRAVESFRNGVAGEHRGASRVRDRLRNLLALTIACAGAAATWWSLWGKK